MIILLVLGFHSMLAYVTWIPAANSSFDLPPYTWLAFPIVDGRRFFGFDLFCAWQDVALMSLLFFLSGLFVWPSLRRKKDWAYLRNRSLRLGLPYLLGIAVVIPIALYPAYSVRTADPTVSGYWHAMRGLPGWPNGPLWFVWQLLALNIAAVGLNVIAPGAIPFLGRWSAKADKNLAWTFGVFLSASALAYVPLAVAYTPWAWSNFGLFAVQSSRPLHYAVYFFAGVSIGAGGIEGGLTAAGGILARRWAAILTVAIGSLLLWMALTAGTMNGGASLGVEIAADLSFVPACAAGGLFLLAACLRYAAEPSRPLGHLAANAYGIYLVHYIFVVWLQFALLSLPLFAVFKAIVVFTAALLLSLLTVTVVRRIPFAARLIGAPRRAVAST